MKWKKKSGLALVVTLVLFLLISAVLVTPQMSLGSDGNVGKTKGKISHDSFKINRQHADLESAREGPLNEDYKEHDPIHIKGDNNFTKVAEKEGWQGSGSKSNPYIIQGYKIDEAYHVSDGIKESVIIIRDVNLHFKIRGNLITEGKTEISAGINILFSNNAVIENNIIKGLDGDYSKAILIQASDITIQNNTITSLATKTSGIKLSYCDGGLIRDNKLDSGGDIGIEISHSKNITTSENTISESRTAGIKLDNTEKSSIKDNIISGSKYSGLHFFVSQNNSIVNNTFYKNEEYGFEIGVEPVGSRTNDNILYNNNFIENEKQVRNRGENQYYNEDLGKGNYWSNYEEKYPDAGKSNGVWNTPYVGNEAEPFTDKYPMVEPSVPYIQIEKPADYMKTKERNVTVEWTASYRYKDNLEYEIRLNENEWKYAGQTTEYELKDLSFDYYSVEVRAANVDMSSIGGSVDFAVIGSNVSVKEFLVEPTEGNKPLEVNISAELENLGTDPGNVSLYVGEEERKTWSLESWEEITVNESLKLEEAGTHLIGIGDKSTEVTVETPKPDISVDDFAVEPSEGEKPLEIDISAEVSNTGDAEGEISLYHGDQEISSWTVDPDENISIQKSYEITETGDHTVKLGDESAEVTVEESSEETPFGGSVLVLFALLIAIALSVYHRRSEKE